jgi:hypothetical protein
MPIAAMIASRSSRKKASKSGGRSITILHCILEAPEDLVKLLIGELRLAGQRAPRRVHAAQCVSDFGQ